MTPKLERRALHMRALRRKLSPQLRELFEAFRTERQAPQTQRHEESVDDHRHILAGLYGLILRQAGYTPQAAAEEVAVRYGIRVEVKK